jgi:hypothetical protein
MIIGSIGGDDEIMEKTDTHLNELWMINKKI